MQDVGAVESLALLNERLGPDRFLRRAQEYSHPEDLCADGVVEPHVVDDRDAVAEPRSSPRSCVARYLCKPVREGQVRGVAGGSEEIESPRDVRLAKEQIEIFREPPIPV
jgi:hypothetical protein